MYWTKSRPQGKPFTAEDPTYGKVYHTASPADVTDRLTAVGYLPDQAIATVAFLGERLGKPLLVEGPAGVGKTETALALSDLLYGGEHNLITINMSEFQEAHTVSTLKGSPPGYVGYGEGGVLTEAVRRRPYSVVLLDEIGRGTSTYDGVAIAWAVTEFLHNTLGCKTIFATHYHELTQLTEELAHARNFNVAVREAGDEIVFLHRLEPGGADRSYGIHVGRLAGLPDAVVRRAWQVLQLLEAGHHVARQAPPADGAPPDAVQLALFAGTAPPHPLLQELQGLDVETMSPLEALNRLADWKARLRERT